MKIHKILTNPANTRFNLSLVGRIGTDVDSRDVNITPSTSNNKIIFGTIYPYKAITELYEGYIGWDRTYIDDNTLDITYVFGANTDPVTFAKTYIDATSNTAYPIVNNYVQYIKTLPHYEVKYTVEDDNGVIVAL